MKRILFAAVAACLFAPAAAPAQLGTAGGWGAGTGAGYEFYNFGDPATTGIEGLSLFVVPLAARATVMNRVQLSVSSAYASATLTRPDGSTAALSGITDTELRVSVPVMRRLVLTGIAALPTGHSEHTDEEAAVAGAIASDLLPFRLSSWGVGGGFGVNAAYAQTLGDYGVGLSAGYGIGREFSPLVGGSIGYRPGSELRLRAAVDRNLGAAGKASLQLSMHRFGEDEFDGATAYRSGNRYLALGSYAFAAPRQSSALVYGGVMHRSEGSFLNSPETAPSQDLFLVGGGLRMPWGRGMLLPSADVRLFRTADGVGQGAAATVGTAAEWPAGAVVLAPTLRARFGNVLVHQGAESGFTGADLGLFVRFGAR